MKNKIYFLFSCLIISLLLSCTFSKIALALSQLEEMAYLKSLVDKVEDNNKMFYEEGNGSLKQFRCPETGRTFEVFVPDSSSSKNIDFLNIFSPYTGKKVFLQESKSGDSEKKEYKKMKVRSPFVNKVFVADIDLETVLLNEEGSYLVCPYTKKQFNINSQVPSDTNMLNNSFQGFQMVKCPDTGKIFKVSTIEGSFPQYITSPYSGKKFKMIKPGDAYESSKIERNFNKNIAGRMSFEGLQQFGYDIFQDNELNTPEEEEVKDVKYTKGQSSLLNKLSDLDKSFNKEGMGQDDAMQEYSVIPVTKDYVLGPGDVLIINIWGKVQQNIELVVDNEGKVILPEAGVIYLWGQTFEDAKKLIGNALDKYYINIKYNISMGKVRAIRVFVLGNVKTPGAQTIMGGTTVFHALIAAGGPAKEGTLRNVIVKRNKKEICKFDLYDLLLEGDNKNDIKMQTDDIVFVGSIGEVVGITGEVKKPAIYEIKGETNLKKFIDMAGGLSTEALIRRIQICRINKNEEKINIDIEFNDENDFIKKSKSTKIINGDLVYVFSINELQRQYVTIDGNVLYPGRYSLKKDMSLVDLFVLAGGFLTGTYKKHIELIRKSQDSVDELLSFDLTSNNKEDSIKNVYLEEWDKVKVYSIEDMAAAEEVEVRGNIGKPGLYRYYKNMRVSDIIFMAGGLTLSESMTSVELYRIDPFGSKQSIHIDLEKILNNISDYKYNILLESGDLLIIRGQSVLANKNIITLEGEVKYPGQYLILEGDRISSIIKRAGGYTDEAYLRGIVFSRSFLKDKQIDMAKKMILNQKSFKTNKILDLLQTIRE